MVRAAGKRISIYMYAESKIWIVHAGCNAHLMFTDWDIVNLTTVLAKGASAGSTPAIAGLRSKEADGAPLQGQGPAAWAKLRQ